MEATNNKTNGELTMTKSNATLTSEIKNLNKKLEDSKKANTVKCDAPKLARKFTYRKSPAIKAQDI